MIPRGGGNEAIGHPSTPMSFQGSTLQKHLHSPRGDMMGLRGRGIGAKGPRSFAKSLQSHYHGSVATKTVPAGKYMVVLRARGK